ncbi:MAG TPA: hypothetical protein VFH85_07625 [Gammaproteobacteria bacterium]|nr:hypothetical protein [Gammaproteobacteria bacterium]
MSAYPVMREWPRNPEIGKPVNPLDNTLRQRAMSILYGLVDDPLPDTADEARDVIRWHTESTHGH